MQSRTIDTGERAKGRVRNGHGGEIWDECPIPPPSLFPLAFPPPALFGLGDCLRLRARYAGAVPIGQGSGGQDRQAPALSGKVFMAIKYI